MSEEFTWKETSRPACVHFKFKRDDCVTSRVLLFDGSDTTQVNVIVEPARTNNSLGPLIVANAWPLPLPLLLSLELFIDPPSAIGESCIWDSETQQSILLRGSPFIYQDDFSIFHYCRPLQSVMKYRYQFESNLLWMKQVKSYIENTVYLSQFTF